MIIFVLSSALGVQSVGNYRLREISSYTDFYDKFISKVVPKDSVISIMPVKSSESFQPNIFMGTNLFSTDGYLSPTPENYSSFLNKLADVGRDNFRYNDLPKMPFYNVENQKKYDEKFKFFKTDYIFTKSKISNHTYVGSYNNYHLYRHQDFSRSIKKLNIEVDCFKEVCDAKSVKYDTDNDKLILNLRFDPSLELTINDKLFDTEQCQEYFLCVDYSPDLIKTAKFEINSNYKKQ